VNTLIFDIETVPDVQLGRVLYGLDGLEDEQVAKAMFTLRRQSHGDEFLPHMQQRIVAISCVLRSRDSLTIWSLGEPASPEAELVQRFFEGLERFSPDLVSWNGGGFDLPVLHYRALKAGVQAARYWETGQEDTAFRYNNYLSRYHWRHVDLMDVLAGFQPRARASLADMALLLGLPGKLGFSGAQVWQAWLGGEVVRVRQYCETDVLNTYLIYLRFELMRGRLSRERHAEEVERVKILLRASSEPHLREFLTAWEARAPADSSPAPASGAAP
jgi:predicted PolB exonuclease-like 3'-5' exonuclease